MRSQRINGLVVVVLMVFGASLGSWAQMGSGQDRSFSYTGLLELDGVAASGPHDFRFVLLTGASGDNACVATADCAGQVFSGELADVPVSAGAFSVGVSVPEATLLASDDLYLAVAVREAGGSAYAPLEGRQRILPTPSRRAPLLRRTSG